MRGLLSRIGFEGEKRRQRVLPQEGRELEKAKPEKGRRGRRSNRGAGVRTRQIRFDRQEQKSVEL
jgi:hypothetical protein